MNLTESVYYVVFMFATFAAMVLACVQTVFSFGLGVTLALYGLMLVALVFILLACRNKSELPPAFDFGTQHKIKLYSYLISVAFVVETVCELLEIYRLFDGKTTAYGGAVLLALTAVSALMSALSFVLVGISYGETNHDFRRIPYLVFAPLLWSILRIAQLLSEFFSAGRELLPTLKVIALVFLMCFLYRFSFEAVKGGKTAKSTLFLSGAVFTAGALFWASHTSALIDKSESVNVLDLGLSLVALTVSYFAIKFRRSIIDRC